MVDSSAEITESRGLSPDIKRGQVASSQVQVILPADLIEDNSLDPEETRSDIEDQVRTMRAELAAFLPEDSGETIEVVLIDDVGLYKGTCEATGNFGSTIRLYSKGRGLAVSSPDSIPLGFKFDLITRKILVSQTVLRAELLHHLDYVNTERQGLPPELDPRWRGELVDVGRMLRPGELEGLPIIFTDSPSEDDRIKSAYSALGSRLGGLFRQDIFPNQTLSPFSEVGHREALMVVRTAFQLAARYGSDRIYHRFIKFALNYRPPYLPLLDIALLADLENLREVKANVGTELEYLSRMKILAGLTARKRLAAASAVEIRQELGELREQADDLLGMVAGDSGISTTEIIETASNLIKSHPETEQLITLVRDMAELGARLSCELEMGSPYGKVQRKITSFYGASFAISARVERPWMTPILDQGEIDKITPSEARRRIDQHWQKTKEHHHRLLSFALDEEQQVIRDHLEREEKRHQNRQRILKLQEVVYRQLLASPFAVQGKTSKKRYPTEVSRLRQPKELAPELNLKRRTGLWRLKG